MDIGAKEQLAMKLLDEAFLQGGMIPDQLGTLQRHDNNPKQDKLRKEAIKYLIDKGYAEYRSQGVYRTTPSGMRTAKERRQ
jgi:hypothetical protein